MRAHSRFRLARTIALLVVGGMLAGHALASAPITTDSRIKTLLFSPNEVFQLTTHYGYQSNIEFGPKETIETISVGDRVGWQISPAGRRLFIRAQEENAHTNMTVITNLRAYQFDLKSSSASAVFGSEELTYVVRFFYPNEENAPGVFAPAVAAPQPLPIAPEPLPAPMPPPVVTGAIPAPSVAPMPVVSAPLPPPATMNYRYTFSGPREAAPVKIYDDGQRTYFKFTGTAIPQVSIVTAQGESLPVPARRTEDGMIVVDVVAPRFTIRQSGHTVLVYTEANGV
jgi:type IV secretion system protein VirB9